MAIASGTLAAIALGLTAATSAYTISASESAKKDAKNQAKKQEDQAKLAVENAPRAGRSSSITAFGAPAMGADSAAVAMTGALSPGAGNIGRGLLGG